MILGGERAGGAERRAGSGPGRLPHARDWGGSHALRLRLYVFTSLRLKRTYSHASKPPGDRKPWRGGSPEVQAPGRPGIILAGRKGHSHDDMKRPPEDGLSEIARGTNPEDVRDLGRGQ